MFRSKHVDIVASLELIDAKINDPMTNLIDIKRYVSEMRSLVNHAKVIYYKANEMLNKNMDVLEDKIYEITDDKEEYSSNWLEFMHKEYHIDDENKDFIFYEHDEKKIKLTKNLSVLENSYIKIEDDHINFKIHNLSLTTTLNELENIVFDYTPDILRPKNKAKRHLGPIKSLETDLARVKNHKIILSEEKNKIKNHIIYNILLYLLLDVKG